MSSVSNKSLKEEGGNVGKSSTCVSKRSHDDKGTQSGNVGHERVPKIVLRKDPRSNLVLRIPILKDVHPEHVGSKDSIKVNSRGLKSESRDVTKAAKLEGSQGKTQVAKLGFFNYSGGEVDDASCDVYESGEYRQQIIKLWTKYEESQAGKALESSLETPTLEIRIPAKYVTYSNHRVCKMQLWGTDVYTVDSDMVAGYFRPVTPPPSAVQEIRATIRLLPPQVGYVSTRRNSVRSRAWGAAAVCSFRVEQCCILKKGGGIVEIKPCQTHVTTMAIEPTFAPAAEELFTMTTRAAAKNALSDQRVLGEVSVLFNLCNEPWPKYSMNAVADKGNTAPLFTSARLKKGEVLYLESHSCRYELCFSGEKKVIGERMDTDGEISMVNVFRWSRLKRPIPQKLMPIYGIPLPSGKVEVVADGLEWEDIKWHQTGVLVAGKEYHLLRSIFLSA